MTGHPNDRVGLKRVATVVGIAAWLGVTIGIATIFFSIAILSVATFFGEPPTAGMRQEGFLFALAGASAAAAGPFGVWVFQRRPAWVYLGIAMSILGLCCTAYIFVL